MKKSFPKNLSADCRSTVGWQITDRLKKTNKIRHRHRITDRLPTVSLDVSGAPSLTSWRLPRWSRAWSCYRRPIDGRQSTDSRQKGFSGSSSSQLPSNQSYSVAKTSCLGVVDCCGNIPQVLLPNERDCGNFFSGNIFLGASSQWLACQFFP